MNVIHAELQKPSHEDWLFWTDVVIDRLSTCVKIYAHPPFDVRLIEKDSNAKKAAALDLLHRVHALIDGAETPTDSLADVAHHDEHVVSGLAMLLQEVLTLLPVLSSDMQTLLKSPWQAKHNGKLAEELFRGPRGRDNEGMGSGYPEHGRLPAVLKALLEREQVGDGRQPREALHRQTQTEAHPQPMRHAAGGQRRWADRGTSAMRSAGQIE